MRVSSVLRVLAGMSTVKLSSLTSAALEQYIHRLGLDSVTCILAVKNDLLVSFEARTSARVFRCLSLPFLRQLCPDIVSCAADEPE